MSKEKEQPGDRCKGGLSLRCNHGPYKLPGNESAETHSKGKAYYCRNCKAYMGCHKCCQQPRELVFLRCHDWALADGEKEHGKMLSKELIGEKWRALQGQIRQVGVEQN